MKRVFWIIIMARRIVWIRAVGVRAWNHGPSVFLILPVVIWLCTVTRARTLVVWIGIVWSVIVGIVMRLRVERVVAVVSLTAWARIVVVVVISCGIRNVFYRVTRL